MESTNNIISRRHFLRGDFSNKTAQMFPPWSLSGNDFINACTRCNECINACPEKIIIIGEGGYPVINFDHSGCSFCQECVTACNEGALSINNTEQLPWNLTANISTECISLHGVTCRSCSDSCDEEAISFRLQVGGSSQPEINEKSCTGCGYCVVTCPVNAIKISENIAHEEYDYEHY
ncbi:MAG: ferredoxin-type protein NapF [Proteobacteria bacterium]|nr:ferredoxin-type protein NapF [Pseudomonadota bacterium]NOG61569.1 ferredoxin-type protein NapF [Pseudomonadota bacterium]